MERHYWEKIAPAYNEEIFDVLQNDKKAFIRSAIRKAASQRKTVVDIGCAIGKWLPILSPAFKTVMAVDISSKNLHIAKKLYPDYKNVEYVRADMSSGKSQLPPADVAICINAILTASAPKRNRFFRNLSACLKKGGCLILVVPSLESWMQTRVIQSRWKIDPSLFRNNLSKVESAKRYSNLQAGNVEIDNVPTKHYLQGELQLLLEEEGFNVIDSKKIEYGWETEFVKVPKWLTAAKPWDWMVVAEKSLKSSNLKLKI